jgi:CBS domain-containing protein
LIGGSVEVCTADETLRQAAQRMFVGDIGSMGVMAAGKLIGIITERDLMQAVATGADADLATVGDWMTTAVDTFSPVVEVDEAALWLLETGYRHLPVVDDDRLLAILSIRDVLAALVEPGGET